jgi:hypothetical protein
MTRRILFLEVRIMNCKRPVGQRGVLATLLSVLLLTTAGAALSAQKNANDNLAAQKQSPKATNQPTTTQPDDSAASKTTSKKTKTEDPEPPREASPAEILKRLQEDTRNLPKPITSPTRPGRVRRRVPAPNSDLRNAIQPAAQKLLPDGSRIVDRPGRLTSEGEYFTFSFESRGRGAPEIPIRLLPNRLLEDMEIASAGGTKPIVFVVSGEVTEYRGVNYLLVQKLLARPNIGNFR